MNCRFERQDSDELLKESVFSALYDDHNYFLSIDDFEQNTETSTINYKEYPINTINIIDKPTQISETSIKNHIKFLSTLQTEYEIRYNAAKTIQNCWRSYYYQKIFSGIKDLVNKYIAMDNMTFLKLMRPREAQLFDAASGIVLRFKLSGTAFPPGIVYKLYSNLPIIKIDFNLNSERKDEKIGALNDTYKNIETNNWLPCLLKRDNSGRKTYVVKSIKTKKPNKADKSHRNREIAWIKEQYNIQI